MQLLPDASDSQSSASTESTAHRKRKPKLSMIWVKEWDGQRQRLVAHWTPQD